MLTNVQEVYERTVRPMSEQERLELAALIISDLSQQSKMDNGKSRSGKKLSDLFGSVSLGHPTGADNESIDADLAREYANSHEEKE
jgi:hypothetical protein